MISIVKYPRRLTRLIPDGLAKSCGCALQMLGARKYLFRKMATTLVEKQMEISVLLLF
jgi:hypothetical protein